MEGLIWDEVPAQRKRKEEQFAFPVVTLSAIEKLGAGRKFSFNAAAQKELDVKGGDRISFGFSTDKKLAAVRKATGDQGFALTQTCTISDKRTYEYMVKMFGLDTAIENHFEISLTNGLYTLSPVIAADVIVKEQIPVFEISTTDVGEISDEEDLGADLRGIPTAESFGIAAAEEVEEMVAPSPIEDEDSTEESVW